MQDESKRRDARMMAAVVGMGGRCALSSEVDLRLGLEPELGELPGWIASLARLLGRHRQARSVGTTRGQPGQDGSVQVGAGQ